MRRTPHRDDDPRMMGFLIEISGGKPLEIRAIVCEKCQTHPRREFQLPFIRCTVVPDLLRRNGVEAAGAQKCSQKYVHILVQI